MQTIRVFLQLALCAAVATGAAAATVYRLRNRNLHGQDASDGAFWNSFVGLVVLLPAVIIPAVFNPLAGAALALLALSAAAFAYRHGPVLQGRRRQRRRRRVARLTSAESLARHDAALAHWRRYELDPGRLIEYPDMSDIRQPATAALVRGMSEVERASTALSSWEGLAGSVSAVREYDRAVLRFGILLLEAERAAGVPAPEQWTRANLLRAGQAPETCR